MINFNNVDSARYFLDIALVELDKNDDLKIRASVYSNYGMSYQDSEDFKNTIYWNLKTIDLLKDTPEKLCHAHYNQGFIYESAGLPDKAREHYRLAYSISKESGNESILSLAISGLSYRLIEDKKLDSAKLYLEEGLELCQSTQMPQICFTINSDIGPLYDQLKLHKKAEQAFLDALRFAKIRNYPQDIMGAYKALGFHNMEKGEYGQAIQYFKQYDELFLDEQRTSSGVEVYRGWAIAEEKVGNYRKSSELYKKYIELERDRLSEENRSFIAEAEEKFNSEKKDKELAEQELIIQQSAAKTNMMTGLLIFLGLTGLLLWFLFQQRQRRKNQEIATLKKEQEVKTLESLMQGEEKERMRIARELHDGVNGDLAAVKYKLTSLLEMNNAVIEEAVTMIDHSCEQVRAISHNLVPPTLKDFNLTEAIESYCLNMNDIHTQAITFLHIGDAITMEKKMELNLFRIVQELVTNCIKHAEASEINVQLSNHQGGIQLSVEDNGKGFDVNQVDVDGIGLANVRSRIDYLNAELDVVSNTEGSAFTINLEI